MESVGEALVYFQVNLADMSYSIPKLWVKVEITCKEKEIFPIGYFYLE